MKNKKEDLHTEFKRAKKSVPKDMWPTVSAFANTDGGTIYLGFTEIKENGNVKGYKATGVMNPETMIKDILDTSNNPRKLYPNVIEEKNVQVKEVTSKVKIIEVYIPRAPFKERPIYINGDQKNSFKRVGTGDKRVNSEDLKAILRDAYGDDSAETLDGFDFTDLNLVDIQNYKAFYAEQNEEPEVIEEDNKHFFKRIGLYRKDRKDKKFKITRALWRTTFDDVIKPLPKDCQETYSLLNDKVVVTYKDLGHLYSSKWKGHQILNDMINKGLIERSGKGPGTKYMISRNLPWGKSA